MAQTSGRTGTLTDGRREAVTRGRTEGRDQVACRRVRCYGIVQGVGFRPTVARHAARTGVAGSVCNKGPYVEIFAQGTKGQVDAFIDLVRHQPPRRADVIKVEVVTVPEAQVPDFDGFRIVESERTRGAIFVSPDIAICDDCKRELFDPTNRRYLHPFINCTCCGPRLTILDSLPYDRERTSMADFPLCPDCAREYRDPASRRYDAQPVCCKDCGPQVFLLDRPERGREAITAARRALAAGRVVAVKGIGGFHLCCDATSRTAVALLRKRKHRPQKPLAVMMRDEEAVRRECLVTPAQEEVLCGHQKPIVLLRRRPGPQARLAPDIAPDNPCVGVMLPYAPIQLLLFDYDDGVQVPDCLVMTSGNVSGAPICRDDEDARSQLSGLADLVLSNDRQIRTRADDTVMDFYRDEPYMIRRSRGYAPLPVVVSAFSRSDAAPWEYPRVLALGGELKNTFCLATGDLFYPSAYVGDLADLRTVRALEESVDRMETLLELEPRAVACDLHPRYNSTALAERLAHQAGLSLVKVQHHYAHVVSCMAENDVAGPVLGVAFDGTGYGEDGTIWGGELMVADYRGFRRLGSIRPFTQVGGDRSSREGWRIAVAMVHGLTGDLARTLSVAEALGLCDQRAARAQVMMADQGLNAIASTSAGRLFDAASAVLGIRLASTFEGEASCALEYAARRAQAAMRPPSCRDQAAAARAAAGREAEGPSPSLPPLPAGWEDLPLVEGDDQGFLVLPTEKVIVQLVRGRLGGEDPEALAYGFHLALARMVVEACRRLSARTGLSQVALSGGCFQNKLLLGLCERGLAQAGLTPLRHHLIAPNDGGIALGQAVVASARMMDGG